MTYSFLTDPIFGCDEIRELLDDRAITAAMIRTEVALARVQADLGIIPEPSARAIMTALKDVEVEANLLGLGVKNEGVPVPALLSALREQLDPGDADWLHYGATSQDIVDTAMCLNFGAAQRVVGSKLTAVLDALEAKSDTHAQTLMLARTRGQLATPISFGLRLAQCAQPLIGLEAELSDVKRVALRVQFGGGSGSRSVLGEHGAVVAAKLAEELDLMDSPPWHTDRSGMRRLANWMSRCIAALAKIGRDFSIASRGEVGELHPANGGGSSTMPHKSNPVTAEALQSIAAVAVAFEAGLAASAVHAEERDGVMWPVEWALMPQLFEAAGAALNHALRLLDAMRVNVGGMRARVDEVPAVRSEAAVFALSSKLGRVAASEIVKDALKAGTRLEDVLTEHGDSEALLAISDAAFLNASTAMIRQIFSARNGGGSNA